MKTSNPLISVIITNYNYNEYVGQAIESVLDQTYNNIELIIIDDGSTDDSDRVIKKYVEKYPKITYISQKNHGVVYTRNRGMEMAKGEYLCCLDADDFFDSDYIAKNYKYITKYNADVVYPNWHIIGDYTETRLFPEFDFVKYQKQHIHVKPESLIRTAAIKSKNGKLRFGYIPETKERANDWAYFISLAANGLKFKLAKDNFINYRVKQNAMHNKFTKHEETRIFYRYLTMLRQRYGAKIIDPIELPIDIIRQQSEDIVDQRRQNTELQRQNTELQRQNTELQRQNTELINSMSWKITRPIRFVRGVMGRDHE